MQSQQPIPFQQLIDTITPEIYANLKCAIEIGKWPDGRALTGEQRELCMQAVIVYETKNIAEADRTGFIDRGSRLRASCVLMSILTTRVRRKH